MKRVLFFISLMKTKMSMGPGHLIVAMLCLLLFPGCLGRNPDVSREARIWGTLGLGDGRFQKPRAMAVSPDGEVFIVDMTARIQVFDEQGTFLRSWQTPKYQLGRPCGLSISNDGMLMVADTHYYRILFYTPEGELLETRTIGGENGRGPGQFGFVTDIVQDSKGNYYVSEYGDYDRIQKFDADGNYLFEWGGHGTEPGMFLRPQGLMLDEQDRIWVADSGNHRIQVFDATGSTAKLVDHFGTPGESPGELRYPYDLFLEGDLLYVCEYGNNRIQCFRRDGTHVATWGGPGKKPGEIYQPWDLCLGTDGVIHILDSYNHRVQSIYWTPEDDLEKSKDASR